jgi:hypothetical protein
MQEYVSLVAVVSRTGRCQEKKKAPMRGAYCSVDVAAVAFVKKRYVACIFNETVISECPLRATISNIRSGEGLSFEAT